MRLLVRVLRALAPVVLLVWVAVPARAATVHVCVKWKPVYADALASLGDDYLTASPATVAAYGVKIVVDDGTNTVFSDYASDTDGCTADFTVTSGVPYTVKAISEARIYGNTLVYTAAGTTTRYATVWSGVTFAAGSGGYLLNTGDSPMSRVMGALSWALHLHSLLVSGETINVYRKTDPTSEPCPNSSCNSGGDVYYMIDLSGVDHSIYKGVLAHELGHQMFAKRTGGCDLDYDFTGVNGVYGSCPATADAHQRDSVEWQSAAVYEGFAQLYAEISFNDTRDRGA
jgi:hypothetical protein